MKRGIVSFLMAALQVLLIVGAGCMAYALGAPTGAYLLMIGCYLFSLLAMPALHEAGHLVFGRAAGMKVASVTLAFWKIERKGKGTRVSTVNPFLENAAGECSMYPAAPSDMKKKFLLFSAGGIAFNALFLVAAIPFLIVFRDNYVLWCTLGMILPYDVYLLLLNLFPFSESFDGAILWGLIANDPSEIAALRILSAQGYMAEGKTLGEINKELLFSLPQLPEDDRYFSVLQYYRYGWYMDRDEWKEAVKCITRLESVLEYVPEEYLPYVYCELVYVYAGIEQNLEKAERYFNALGFTGGRTGDAAFVRAKLAYAKACDLEDMEKEAVGEIRTALENESTEGSRRYEEKLLKELYEA